MLMRTSSSPGPPASDLKTAQELPSPYVAPRDARGEGVGGLSLATGHRGDVDAHFILAGATSIPVVLVNLRPQAGLEYAVRRDKIRSGSHLARVVDIEHGFGEGETTRCARYRSEPDRPDDHDGHNRTHDSTHFS